MAQAEIRNRQERRRPDRFLTENLRDYRQTAAVAEKYYKARLFPNRFFPLLFPVAPLLRLGERGDIALFWHEHLLFFQDITSHVRISHLAIKYPSRVIVPPAGRSKMPLLILV